MKSYTPSRAQKKKLTKSAAGRSATAWWQKEKRKTGGMRLCDNCGAVYFDGHWHTAPALSMLLKQEKAKKPSKDHDLCIQCRWASRGGATVKSGFEGLVTLDGLTDLEEKAEILATARNVAKKAQQRDPEDHIIAIEDRGERVVISTTENQLAAAIGKAVDAAFKGGKLTITWGDDDLPVRVYWKRKA